MKDSSFSNHKSLLILIVPKIKDKQEQGWHDLDPRFEKGVYTAAFTSRASSAIYGAQSQLAAPSRTRRLFFL